MPKSAIELLQEQVNEAKAKHDAVLAKVAPILAEREKKMVKASELMDEANAMTAQVNAIYAENDFMALAKKYGSLADAVMRVRQAS